MRAPPPTLDARSAFVDGGVAARPPRRARVVFACDDDRHAMVVTARRDDDAAAVFRWRLDDGALEPTPWTAGGLAVAWAPRAERLFSLAASRGLLRWCGAGGAGELAIAPYPRSHRLTWMTAAPDGRHVALVFRRLGPPRRGAATLLRVDDGAVVARDVACTHGAAFSDDGRFFVSTDEGDVALVRVSLDDGSVRRVSLAGGLAPRSVTVERGGMRAAVRTALGDLRVFSLHELAEVGRFDAPTNAVVEGFASGVLVYRWRDPWRWHRRVLDVDAGEARTLPCDEGWWGPLTPDGTRLLASRPPVLGVVDLESGARRSDHDGHESAVCHVAWSPAGDRLVTLSDDGVAHVWDVARRERVWELETPRGRSAAAIAHDGRALWTWGPRGLCAWEMSTGHELRRHPGLGLPRVLRVELSRDGLHVLSSSGVLRRLTDDVARRRFDGQPRAYEGWRFADDETLAVDDPLRTLLRRVRLADGVELPPVMLPDDLRWSLRWRLDGDRVLGWRGGRDAFAVWDARAPRAPLRWHPTERPARALDAAAGLVVTAAVDAPSPGPVCIYGIDDGALAARVEVTRLVADVALSPTGSHLAITYRDGGVEVFSLTPAR